MAVEFGGLSVKELSIKNHVSVWMNFFSNVLRFTTIDSAHNRKKFGIESLKTSQFCTSGAD